MRENCKQKRTRPTPIRRILECRPLCGLKGSGLNSASFLLRRTPSQHSRGIASKVSVYLFVSPSSYSSKLFLTSLVSLSLSLSSERLGKLPLDCISQIPRIVTWSFDWTPLHPTPVEALISCSSLTFTTIFVQICRKSHKPSEAIQLFQAETF